MDRKEIRRHHRRIQPEIVVSREHAFVSGEFPCAQVRHAQPQLRVIQEHAFHPLGAAQLIRIALQPGSRRLLTGVNDERPTGSPQCSSRPIARHGHGQEGAMLCRIEGSRAKGLGFMRARSFTVAY
jgi:hypothetical protein